MRTALLTSLTFISLTALTGCGGSSNTSKEPVIDLPKANYQFSQADKDAIINERQPITQGLQVTFKGQLFDHLLFSHKEAPITYFKLESDNHEQIIFMLYSGDQPGQCGIYDSHEMFETFACETARLSVGEDTTVLSTVQTSLGHDIAFEYQNEILELAEYFGSTELTVNTQADPLEIVTQFAFGDFYEDILCQGPCEAVMYSDLGASTYFALERIEAQLGSISQATLVFNNPIGGSVDDDINMYTGLMIRDNQMNTRVSQTGSVFSGGTDLFAAGVTRTLEVAGDTSNFTNNQQIGVHSWSEDGKTAKDYPYTHESHRKQATYFVNMLNQQGIAFYVFTLDAAPAEGAHYMNKQELTHYNLVTQFN